MKHVTLSIIGTSLLSKMSVKKKKSVKSRKDKTDIGLKLPKLTIGKLKFYYE